MKKLIIFGLAIFALIISLSVYSNIGGAQVKKVMAASNGGPIVLDGMDPVCHAAYGQSTDQYIAKVLKSVYDKSTMPSNNGKIAILGVSNINSAAGCGGNWNTLLSTKFLTQFSTAPTVQFITTAAELNTFFSTDIASNPPRMLWIPDDWSRSGTIDGIFTSNAEKIADFVNSGGGLFTSNNGYGWLTSLLPSATFNNGGCNGGPEATADGIADFGLNNSIVAACWHGYFTGSFGTLKTLVDYPYPAPTDTRKSVSIGGGEVSLPSSFTLEISPDNPDAGTDLTITATAKTIAGVAQPNVPVTITVSSGPDAGQTFTATTDSTGVAVITVRTSATGTAVYTATAVVNGVTKTVSKTVTWNVPPTTTTIETTTTSTSSTTTSTTSPAVVIPVVTTTIAQAPIEQEVVVTPLPRVSSDKKTDALPKTGNDSSALVSYGLALMALGFSLTAAVKTRAKLITVKAKRRIQ